METDDEADKAGDSVGRDLGWRHVEWSDTGAWQRRWAWRRRSRRRSWTWQRWTWRRSRCRPRSWPQRRTKWFIPKNLAWRRITGFRALATANLPAKLCRQRLCKSQRTGAALTLPIRAVAQSLQ